MKIRETGGIKNDSVIKIFNAIVDKKINSRSGIARAASLSLMTVGKAADAFARAGLLSQSKERKNAPGRKASLITPDEGLFYAIYDASGFDCGIYIYDIYSSLVEVIPVEKNCGSEPPDSLSNFSPLIKKYNFEKNLGLGIINGFSKSNGLYRADENLLSNDSITSAAYFLKERDEKIIFYISPANPPRSCLIVDGKPITGSARSGVTACDIVRLGIFAGGTFGGSLRSAEATAETTAKAEDVIANFIAAVCPDAVALEPDGRNSPFPALLRMKLAECDENIRFIDGGGIKISHRGMINRLARGIFFDD